MLYWKAMGVWHWPTVAKGTPGQVVK